MSLRDYPFRIYYGPADDPLNNFYIPALSASVRYDRSAGFFSSTALAVAAAGVARLIQNGGRMRLLVGAALDEGDVEAITRGHDLQARLTERLLEHFADPQDALLRQRLEVLAWMVAEGTLEIRVVLPRDERGLPIPARLSQDYYHPKTGIFTDADGNRMAFSGSVNESETGWTKNYENFLVVFSWEATQAHLAQIATNFERLWTGQEPGWIALDVPKAVRDRLLTYRPPHAPEFDPLERAPSRKPTKDEEQPYAGEVPQAERILFQFVRDAPYLPNATELGAATAAIVPWPHQSRVANVVIRRFPDRAMLCDEVGLGKTIEAGLVIRQLLLSGRVKRCLILAPKSVLKQWQEELYEKFALEIPRYEAGGFLDVRDQPLPAPDGNPWDAFDVLLAGSQLVKRADRREQILAAKGWDLLVADEAHHARRKDFKERIYRPNRLLGLLNDLKAQDKYAGLLLMTATPMQVHPLEVWDLLTVLGMGGRWGADEDNFLGFFAEMHKPFDDRDWEFVFDLVQDYLTTGGEIDPEFKAHVGQEIGPVKWSALEDLVRRSGQRLRILRQLGRAPEPHVAELARRHTPLNHYIFRNTRALLREYQQRGILKDNVPTRRPRLERVPMRPEERALYDRIDEYISAFYQKYESERRGLGFVMTVYRRRLTSSFYAVRRSLERRLQFLRGLTDEAFVDDDLEQDELEQDVLEEVLSDADRERFKAELTYVEDFIHELRLLSVNDSKLEVLKSELGRIFTQRPTVLIFTQYADTMDYLRDQLVEVYGSQVACYSGRGGEVWNGIAWVRTTKEDVKNQFREGSVRILIGTESASEGLNLQTCGVLINYDMPWNPMRVEQRIGRIDRIGQQFDIVWISNYFYQDTIEDVIYRNTAKLAH
ncbi:MAG TPA: helicase-related protein [Anaerolineae bacterium]|nr:helicase-related protein [Anaerolineae bacterium]